MQIVHPQANAGGIAPEDIFLAVDDLGLELGRALIVYQYQPHLCPDRPLNLYFSLDSKPNAVYLLFGAVVARARQLRDMNPGAPARVYTSVQPDDTRMLDFYAHNGLSCDDTEELVRLTIPAGEGRIPMSCRVAQTPLNGREDIEALCGRMQQNDLTHITPEAMDALMRQPHFLALGLYRNAELIGEILTSGYGDTCEIAAMYVTPPNRRQGMGRALLHRAIAIMAAEGVSNVMASRMNRSEPQRRLLNGFQPEVIRVSAVYPGLYL